MDDGHIIPLLCVMDGSVTRTHGDHVWENLADDGLGKELDRATPHDYDSGLR